MSLIKNQERVASEKSMTQVIMQAPIETIKE